MDCHATLDSITEKTWKWPSQPYSCGMEEELNKTADRWMCNLGTLFVGLNPHNEVLILKEILVQLHETPNAPIFHFTMGVF